LRRRPRTAGSWPSAREHAGEPARRHHHPSSEHADALVAAYTTAIRAGELVQLTSLLAADAVLYNDGGGEVAAARKPIYGAAKITRFFTGLLRKGYFGPELSYAPVRVNGQRGLLRPDASGRPRAVIALELIGETILAIQIINNPRKLTHVPARTASTIPAGQRLRNPTNPPST
jgi:RNA polymerase sigma-70 factor, ECF subfamily